MATDCAAWNVKSEPPRAGAVRSESGAGVLLAAENADPGIIQRRASRASPHGSDQFSNSRPGTVGSGLGSSSRPDTGASGIHKTRSGRCRPDSAQVEGAQPDVRSLRKQDTLSFGLKGLPLNSRRRSSISKYFVENEQVPGAVAAPVTMREKIMAKRQSILLVERRQSQIQIPLFQSETSENGAALESVESLASSDSEDEANGPKCGMILDMLYRKCKDHEGKDRGTAWTLQKLAEHDSLCYEYAKDALLRDEFVGLVFDDVTKFYKDEKAVREASKTGKAWPRTTAADMRAIVKGIVKYKHQVGCLKVEVYNCALMYKLLHTYVPPHLETLGERLSRKDDFWTQYHKRLHRNDLPPISPNNRSTMAATTGGYSSNWLEKKPMCFAADEQWTMIESIEERSSPVSSRDRGRPSPNMLILGDKSLSPAGRRTDAASGMLPPIDDAVQHNRQASQSPSNASSASPSRQASKALPDSGTLQRSSSEPTFLTRLKGHKKSKASVALPPIAQNYYLEACQRCWIVPTPFPFVTGHSSGLHAARRNMMDSDLKAVAPMLQEVGSIEAVDLTGNILLTEKALVPFLKRLFGEPSSSMLKMLILKDLKHIGTQSMDIIRSLMSEQDGLRSLTTLDLNRVHISPKCHLNLAKAIHSHPSVESVNLSDTGLGSNQWIAFQCVELLFSPKMKKLDIGWNCFDADVFQHLGETLVEKRKLEKLSVSNCSAAQGDAQKPCPVSFFIECLAEDTMLTSLDLSLNRMDYKVMLILEDSLAQHEKIASVDLSNNPLGTLGIRSALRNLCCPTNGLVHIDTVECFNGVEVHAHTFDMVNPGAKYFLNLALPYHRSMLRMLYKVCEKFNQQPDQAFLELKFSKAGWSHAVKGGIYGRYDVPKEGNVNFVFSIESAIEMSIKGICDDDFGGFIDQHAMLTKIRPNWKKAVPLFACWRALESREKDLLVFLQALSKDFCLLPEHVDHMCHSCPTVRPEIIFCLLPCVLGGECAESLCQILFPTISEFLRNHKRMRNFIDFNIENPTGHYKLDLSSCADYSVAVKLLLLDRWEVVLARKNNHRDISQRGNHSHMRNEVYRHKPIHAIHEWCMPETDELEFDYTSGRRCPLDAVMINEKTFHSILLSLFEAECTSVSKIEALRLVSHHIYMKAKQMRELLGSFKLEEERALTFVTFYLRVRDMWNSKIFRVRFVEAVEVKKLQDRLGYVTFFPFMQPENAHFHLDLQFNDQKICANMVLQLASKEGAQNLRDVGFVHADGTVDPLTTGVPNSWEVFEKMPKAGIFKAGYQCAPENRKFATRQMLAETYGSLSMDVEENEVMWWTGLAEVTEDVLAWLEFCMSKYKTMDEVFTELDGAGGNGLLSLREFEEGLREMECKKFEGKDEQTRIRDVFRYLDPGGEGTVSREEWNILQQLRKEYDLVIDEFVQFLQRTFGADLHNSWEFLDDDGSGELDLDEWMHACQEIGYFGPARCVFGLLDNSNDNSVSIEEFMVLEAYKHTDVKE